MKKRIVSLLLALVMVLSLVPATVWAAENHDGQVRVVVENTTYAKANGAAWDGTLVDKWVDLAPGSSMMDCIVSALGTYSQTGAESGFGLSDTKIEDLRVPIPRPAPSPATSARSTACPPVTAAKPPAGWEP